MINGHWASPAPLRPVALVGQILRFKFAGRNLVGLQVQVDSEVNSDLSQVLVEDRSGSRPGHGPLTENEGIIILKKSYWAVPMGPPLRQPARSVGWPLRPRPAQNLKLQGNEYFQWKQRVLRSNLVQIINLHVLLSTNSLVFNCFRCILQIESL